MTSEDIKHQLIINRRPHRQGPLQQTWPQSREPRHHQLTPHSRGQVQQPRPQHLSPTLQTSTSTGACTARAQFNRRDLNRETVQIPYTPDININWRLHSKGPSSTGATSIGRPSGSPTLQTSTSTGACTARAQFNRRDLNRETSGSPTLQHQHQLAPAQQRAQFNWHDLNQVKALVPLSDVFFVRVSDQFWNYPPPPPTFFFFKQSFSNTHTHHTHTHTRNHDKLATTMVATPRRRQLALNVALRRIIRNGAPRTATSTFTRLLNSEGGRRTNAKVKTRAECKNNGMDKSHNKIIKVSPISGNGFERGIFCFSEGVIHILHRNTYSQHVWIERMHWKSSKNGEKLTFKELYHSHDFQCSEEG